LYCGSVKFRGGYAITADERNKCLNEVFAPVTKRETVANFHTPPELRHRGAEFERNLTAGRLRHNGYDDALLHPAVSLVRYQYSLAGPDATCYQD
jgi:hypothetical protein